LESTWEESNTRTFNLPEENCDIFGSFVRWSYGVGRERPFKTLNEDDDTDILLVETYLFAERQGCYDFQNDTVDSFAKWWGMENKERSAEAIMLLFSETPPSSKLRRFIAEKTAWEGKAEDMILQSEDTIHPEFAIAVYKAILERLTIAAIDPPYDACFGCTNGRPHFFRCRRSGCGKAPEKPSAAAGSRRIAGSDQAPYQNRKTFCDRYHTYEKSKTAEIDEKSKTAEIDEKINTAEDSEIGDFAIAGLFV